MKKPPRTKDRVTTISVIAEGEMEYMNYTFEEHSVKAFYEFAKIKAKENFVTCNVNFTEDEYPNVPGEVVADQLKSELIDCIKDKVDFSKETLPGDALFDVPVIVEKGELYVFNKEEMDIFIKEMIGFFMP